jgi:hypothetical protein
MIGPFELKFDHLNTNSTVLTEELDVLIVMAPKNLKKSLIF